MILIGMYDSLFVRRVAITLQRLQIPYEHANWSVGADLERIRQYSSLGRVPALVLDDGEVLVESAAILDYLDDLVGPQRALVPEHGAARRHVMQIMALAIGAAEKGREIIYDWIWRPEHKRHEPWVERCRSQMHGALAELEKIAARRGAAEWLAGAQLTQADITTACVYTFLNESVDLSGSRELYPALGARVLRCEALPEFVATRTPWLRPAS